MNTSKIYCSQEDASFISSVGYSSHPFEPFSKHIITNVFLSFLGFNNHICSVEIISPKFTRTRSQFLGESCVEKKKKQKWNPNFILRRWTHYYKLFITKKKKKKKKTDRARARSHFGGSIYHGVLGMDIVHAK